jgi:hypothetical protein
MESDYESSIVLWMVSKGLTGALAGSVIADRVHVYSVLVIIFHQERLSHMHGAVIIAAA